MRKRLGLIQLQRAGHQPLRNDFFFSLEGETRSNLSHGRCFTGSGGTKPITFRRLPMRMC